jgi:hypothetical protein
MRTTLWVRIGAERMARGPPVPGNARANLCFVLDLEDEGPVVRGLKAIAPLRGYSDEDHVREMVADYHPIISRVVQRDGGRYFALLRELAAARAFMEIDPNNSKPNEWAEYISAVRSAAGKKGGANRRRR